MGDLHTARRHFDRAMDTLARHGRAAALPEFVTATDADPSMADAWLGRIAAGDDSLATLKQLYANSEWLHRETTRLGRTLSADIQLGPYVGITVTDASQVGLALSSALAIAGEHAEADTLLDNRELLDSWANYQWHQLARTFLMYATQRWPDVLSTAAEELPPQAIVMSAVTGSICAFAAHAAAHLGQGRVAMDWLDRVDVIGQSRSSARFDARVLTASIGPADIPLLVADLAYVRGMVYRQLNEEDQAQIWLSKATINGMLTEAAKEALADPNLRLVVTSEETISSRTDRWDPSTAKSRDELHDDDAADRRAELLAEGRELLANQVGLAAVKQAVSALEDQLEVRVMRLEHGLPVEGQTNHMLLVGPPGTGKTTTAEALGKIYAGLGIVRHPEVREVRRSDFCGHYIGESGPKTNELIEKSLGRIIFMDEFYSLVERHQDGTPDMIGMEAVNQLLVKLETHRFDFCFIGAGYEDQVDEFLSVNPGLAGRFNRKLRFESYSPTEIVEIGQRYAAPRASLLDEAARETFLDAATTIRNYTTPGGQHGIDAMQNGRFARNVIERAEGYRDTRVVAQKRAGRAVSVEDLQMIAAGDVEAAVRSVCADNRDMAAIVW
ncbi:ESX-2 secretion system protein EccA2 [Mycobacterium marinum]|uniref:type VII secretion AAA-ATPase EccA n=1 Tax=Mycobacterium marinum TaxID=1781 RepID=UPI0021C4598F|nr:type VII secretion AAA-ATPase EccA [Mycobacterium marinum]GJO04900.1 ESX-2 secretion system protein EccA2 [Mycobacterium marinum]GJO18345.1 ESX-2 secretion system protein EccA2 [Mycobacterium marinum]GJO44164.1 ESX-2 secretion system protein EccA2 [Mycobacterium marinum]GJO64838.1 ESX-2 secretion system protein EccA2 [Mycobacterium marinum]GJO66821.1 ESX-2 secretion system protein EccA2 [Mycobacterium marinum]